MDPPRRPASSWYGLYFVSQAENRIPARDMGALPLSVLCSGGAHRCADPGSGPLCFYGNHTGNSSVSNGFSGHRPHGNCNRSAYLGPSSPVWDSGADGTSGPFHTLPHPGNPASFGPSQQNQQRRPPSSSVGLRICQDRAGISGAGLCISAFSGIRCPGGLAASYQPYSGGPSRRSARYPS